MQVPALSRRAFLVAAGGVVLVACGGSKDGGTTATTTPSVDFKDVSAGVLSADLYPDPTARQRLAFALLGVDGAYASGPALKVAVAPPGQTARPSGLRPAALHAEGLPPQRAVYTIEQPFPQAGAWTGIMERNGERHDFAFQVNDHASTLVPGDRALASPTPTTTAPLGVKPICTADPPCALHTRSLDTLVGKGRPVGLLFATPARCQSQYCGPVLETLLTVVPAYRDRVDFVHVEIYKNDTTNDLVDAVKAWRLPSEPWLFTIGGDGTVRDRLDGAFDAGEMRAALDRLVA
jgi:hypothetical protein